MFGLFHLNKYLMLLILACFGLSGAVLGEEGKATFLSLPICLLQVTGDAIFTFNIGAPEFVTILVPNFEQVCFTACFCVSKNCCPDQKPLYMVSDLILHFLLRPHY